MTLIYYIKNLVGSFIALCTLAGILTIIFRYSTHSYEDTGAIFGIIIMLFGLTIVGYINSATALDNKIK